MSEETEIPKNIQALFWVTIVGSVVFGFVIGFATGAYAFFPR